MPKIDWNDSFGVGNDEIDRQHKKWIGIFNDLHDAMLNDDLTDYRAMTTQSLQDMLDYAKVHFAFEEKYMANIGYPDLVAHRRLHKDFDTQIYQCYRDAEDGHTVLNTKIIKMVRNWLVQHIMIEDMKYKLFAQQRG
ncbi:MAG: hemerythrin family protein [Deltaproteobacteria bacterium]|nr:hemerythrin family protein [Deltaproteobacteria bacterium]